MSFQADCNELARTLRQKRVKKNPALGQRVVVKAKLGGPMMTTTEAAAALNRKAQTLRGWACMGTGPIQPVRINGRLAWRAADVNALLNGEGG